MGKLHFAPAKHHISKRKCITFPSGKTSLGAAKILFAVPFRVVILLSDIRQQPVHHFLSALFRHGELALLLHFAQLIAELPVPVFAGDIYAITKDLQLSELQLQPEEVQAVKWASLEEIVAMIDSGEFIPYHKDLIGLLFFMRNHRGTFIREDVN